MPVKPAKITLTRQTRTLGYVGFSCPAARESMRPTEYRMDEATWMEMGKPDAITLTVATTKL